MKALILAAGYATRLYPLTKEYPKPLLMVGKRPLIDYIIEKLDAVKAIDEIIVVTNSKFIGKFEKWAAGPKTVKKISLVDDLTKTLDDRRGAIGDMHFVVEARQIDDDLLVIGGDNLFDDGLGAFLDFAEAKRPNPVIGAYDIKDRAQATKYGIIKLDAQNRIVDFQEKPAAPQTTLAAMCLYYFPREGLGLIGEYMSSKTAQRDATGFYINWLSQRGAAYAFIFEGRWYDIGHPDVYREANERFNGK